MFKTINIYSRTGGFRGLLWITITLLNVSFCSAQKYTFTHYNISDGLIQSQINSICQDADHNLWLATYGGVSRFDGKTFASYSRQDGLPNNFIYTIFCDRQGKMWFGTQNGLATISDKKISVYPTSDRYKVKYVTSIAQDSSGAMWYVMRNHLISMKTGIEAIGRPVICLATDPRGKIYASVYKKGIYCLNKDKWVNIIPYTDSAHFITKIIFDKADAHKMYLLNENSLLYYNGSSLQPYETDLVSKIPGKLVTVGQDANANLWLGTTNGAYLIKSKTLTHFTDGNGFTDKEITDIYRDRDDNLWLASQGDGLYKYEGDSFLTFDRSQGLPNNQEIMGITRDKDDNILIGINGGGLVRYKNNKWTPVIMPSANPNLKRVVVLYTDKRKTVWIGTELGGLWKYNGKDFTQIAGSGRYSINGIAEDDNGVLWAATPNGCFTVTNDKWKRLDGFPTFSFSVAVIGRDSVLIGTHDGIILGVNGKKVNAPQFNLLKTSAAYCILKYHGMLLVGTDDRGLFSIDMKTGQVKNYSVNDGLNSNAIYSLTTDENSIIFAGTGRGVNRIFFNAAKKSFTISASTSPNSILYESNQNAGLYMDHKVWIGTSSGVVVYKTDFNASTRSSPNVIIQSVRVLDQNSGNGNTQGKALANGSNLSHTQDHLTFSFIGVYLKDPQSVYYRYKLNGLDNAFSGPVKNSVVDYPSLPPGNYTFEVKAYTEEGLASKNTASFSFSIIPPFYQTDTFRVLAGVFLILTGILLELYRQRIKARRQRLIDVMRRDETLKIRQQTAEDFHDELGNKLTRITVLSDMLDTKMDPIKTDQKKLLEQIRQNASSLYKGTKDILWALDPHSNNLYEMLNHIKDFGNELFQDTNVSFKFNGIAESYHQVTLPIQYTRNILMIFKELLNNVLKHANATCVEITLTSFKKNEIQLTITDNGTGFKTDETYNGQGITNITTRTSRINGNVEIFSGMGSGTAVVLNFKIDNNI
jgi:ligand-binding sensor domain-containing protein/signal transduction histidine kinase